MKKLVNLLLFLTLLAGTSSALQAQTGRVQFLHNAPDPALSNVKVFVNGDSVLSSFSFRDATPFLDLPAGQQRVNLTPLGAIDTTNSLLAFDVNVTANQADYVIVSGVDTTSNFAPNPEGNSTAAQAFQFPADTTAGMGMVRLNIFHGSTDAPAVDIKASGMNAALSSAVQAADSAVYGNNVQDVDVPEASYNATVQANANDSIVTIRRTNLNGLGGGGALVVASGFLDPSSNQNGPGFELLAVLKDGTVLTLPEKNTYVNLVHNSPDPAVDTIAVALNGEVAFPEVPFQGASGFIPVPGKFANRVHLLPQGATDTANALVDGFDYTAEDDTLNYFVVNGVVDTINFASNPEGKNTGVKTYKIPGDTSAPAGDVRLNLFHGSTDAPAVDIKAAGLDMGVDSALTAADSAVYGNTVLDVDVPENAYNLIIQANANDAIVTIRRGDLNGMAGGSALVLASGFLDPSANQNGPGFDLILVMADGTVKTLPMRNAKVSVLHNAADPAAEEVSLWLNGQPLVDTLDFRSVTPYVNVPADFANRLHVGPPGAADTNAALAGFDFNPEYQVNYNVIANGVLNPANFEPNPEGESTAFTLFVVDSTRRDADVPAGQIDLYVFHGATDAPAVDVLVDTSATASFNDAAVAVDSLTYGSLTPYVTLPNLNLQWFVQVLTNAANAPVETYAPDQQTLAQVGQAGAAAIVYATGFLDSTQGPSFHVWASLPDVAGGISTPFAIFSPTGVEDGIFRDATDVNGYPNPVQNRFNLDYTLENPAEVSIRVLDVQGRTLERRELGRQAAGEQHLELNTREYPAGAFLVQLRIGDRQVTMRALKQ